MLFDDIACIINQFAEELAEQRLQEKMSRTGRGPERGSEKTEKRDGKRRWFDRLTKSGGIKSQSKRDWDSFFNNAISPRINASFFALDQRLICFSRFTASDLLLADS